MKSLKVLKLPQGQMYRVIMEKGGSVPECLSGLYNKRKFIEKAILDYETARDAPKREYRKSQKFKETKKRVGEK